METLQQSVKLTVGVVWFQRVACNVNARSAQLGLSFPLFVVLECPLTGSERIAKDMQSELQTVHTR